MLSAGLVKEETITITVADYVFPNHPFPGGVVAADSGIEVAKDDKIVGVWNCCNNRGQVFVELVLQFIWIGHSGCINTDQGGKFLPVRQREPQRHEGVVHSFRRASQLSDKR